MSKMINRSTSESSEEGPSVKHLTGRLSSNALERRRVLLTSLGKGSVVIAAASAPLKLLAGQTTISGSSPQQRCSVSGQQSGVHSQTVGGAVCTAHSPGYWHKCDHWLSAQTQLLVLATGYPTFKTIFGGAAENDFTKLSMVALITGVGNDKNDNNNCPASYPTTKLGVSSSSEWHWACAWMNAVAGTVSGSGIMNFPYTPAEVIAFYQGSNAAAALAFFTSIEGAGFGGPPN